MGSIEYNCQPFLTMTLIYDLVYFALFMPLSIAGGLKPPNKDYLQYVKLTFEKFEFTTIKHIRMLRKIFRVKKYEEALKSSFKKT
jgi:hypothetical protein